jgi:serine/threonine protein kinase
MWDEFDEKVTMLCQTDNSRVFLMQKPGTTERLILKTSEHRIQAVRECSILSDLSHPHIVSLLSFRETEDCEVEMLFPFLSHGDMFSNWSGGGLCRPPKAVLCKMMLQLASAIQYCHEKGIIHRDIKSENVMMLNDDNDIVLIDFGIAFREDLYDSALPIGVAGTVAGCAPEMLSPVLRPYTKAVDVWAFGVMLYELLTAYEAFPPLTYSFHASETYSERYSPSRFVESYQELQRSVIHDVVQFPTDVVVEDEWKHLILRCLQKRAAQRATIEEVIATLVHISNSIASI